ncbi:PHB depolymerase family esterase [Archangium sp.]|uniref:extracellular catalytic domain type 1 short-chain-length polyhydroxyalkanoate depolymerase n=1 Tax=Archangium sp. TaxID=1872627 RepID=UPI002D35C827|nr:PHB depolymerase family esterase [Archangium sp.]HYO51657.1 PHB depolymerase family esterase [Archangium sp.]
MRTRLERCQDERPAPYRGIPLSALLLACLLGCSSPGLEEEDGAFQVEQLQQELAQVTSFGTNPGNLLMYTHVPAGMPTSAPLVVVLHGCTQTAAAMEGSGWTAAANLYKFYLVYPQQQSANNSSSCFNWFEPGDIARGQGEALSIKQMVDHMKASYSINASRVYVVGLSAGAYMVSAMMATYPDVFAGGAIDAGGPYKCASTSTEAFSCMGGSVTKTALAWGDLVRNAYPGYTGPRPKVMIWQGTSDFTVKPVNMTEAMKQWTNVLGIDEQADTVDTVAGYPHKVYRNSSGAALVETFEITNMGHAIAIDPQFSFPGSTTACGTTGSYISDVNICSTYYQAQFFGLTGGTSPGDTTPPTVNVTSPANGATVSGTLTVTASASDAVGVTKVELYVDGTLVSTDTAAPYELSWNTTTVANGSHALMARAYDAAGNTGVDNDTGVTVSNSGSSTTVTFSSIAADDGYVKALAAGSSPELGALVSLALGRGTDGKFNRTLLSFDTSSLPDTATISRAYLTITWSSGSGDPWANPAGNTLVIDVKRGTFGLSTTETTDWAAAPDASAVASIAKFISGTKASGDFDAAGLSAINKLGKTQLKLRFSQDQTATNYLFIGEGASSTLTVVYTP